MGTQPHPFVYVVCGCLVETDCVAWKPYLLSVWPFIETVCASPTTRALTHTLSSLPMMLFTGVNPHPHVMVFFVWSFYVS